MTAKEYLKRLGKLDTIIRQKREELNELRLASENISSLDYSGERVQGGNITKDSMAVKIATAIDLEKEIQCEIHQFIHEKHNVINQIQGLSHPNYIDILYKHYVELKRFEIVAVEMNYTYQYVVELHGHALKEFQTTYKNLLKTYI